jgi:hypothetical protein
MRSHFRHNKNLILAYLNQYLMKTNENMGFRSLLDIVIVADTRTQRSQGFCESFDSPPGSTRNPGALLFQKIVKRID